MRLATRMVDELAELLTLKGHAVTRLDRQAGFTLTAGGVRATVVLVERLGAETALPALTGEGIVLTLDARLEEPPAGYAVIDLLARQLHGTGGPVLDAVREHCRKRGIRLSPGPWRYPGGHI
jgi:hypothetical protein